MTSLQQLWTDLQNSAFAQFLDTDYRQLILAGIALIVVWVVRRPLARVISYWPRRLAARSEVVTAAQAKELFEGPLRLVIIGVAIFAFAAYAVLEGGRLDLVQRIGRTVLAIAFFRFVLMVLPLVRAEWDGLEKTFGSELVDWIAKGLRVATIFVGAATILQLWGVQVAPIIAGAGLFGVAVALGAQTFFKNLIGGMLILAGKKFYKGEWIEVPGVIEGTVESIGFHSTVVRRFDKAPVTLPNTLLSDSAVINYSRRPHRRISLTVGVVYQTTVPQLGMIRDQIEQYILSRGEFVDPPQASVLVRVDKFNESSIDFIVYCFTQTSDWGEWLKIKEELVFEILRIVEQSGSALAYPSQTLFLQLNEAEPTQSVDHSSGLL